MAESLGSMMFADSVETHKDVYENIWVVARVVRSFLQDEMSKGEFAASDIEVLYVPVVMPEDIIERYPERSRLRRRTKTAICSPQLNYQVFLSESRSEQLAEYLRGLMNVVPLIAKLEGDDVLSSKFSSLIRRCYDVCAEQLKEGNSR